jgi:hypothetical protein
MASVEHARTQGGYVAADKVIAGLRKRLASAQHTVTVAAVRHQREEDYH